MTTRCYNKVSLSDVLENREDYYVLGIEEEVPTPKVEWVSDKEGCKLPKLHFSWVVVHGIELTPAQFASLTVPLQKRCKKSSLAGSDQYYMYVVEQSAKGPRRENRYFCNFRRYSWSASHSEEQGYSSRGDVDYVNSAPLGVKPESPEDVVRLSFVKALAQLDVPGELKYHVAVRPLLHRLLKDALENIRPETTRGCLEDTNGGICDIEVQGEPWTYSSRAA